MVCYMFPALSLAQHDSSCDPQPASVVLLKPGWYAGMQSNSRFMVRHPDMFSQCQYQNDDCIKRGRDVWIFCC